MDATRTVQNLAVGLVAQEPPGRASVDQAFWQVGKVERERAWWFLEAPAGVRLGAAWVCVCQVGGAAPQVAQIREIRTGMPGDSVLWGE